MSGAQLSHLHYSSRRVGLAWDSRGPHVPIFMGFGQFSPYILSLEEQANSVRSHEAVGIFEQLGQGRAGPSRDNIKGPMGQAFHPRVFNSDVQTHALCGGTQECAFLGGGFVQGHGQLRPHGGQHQTWKTRAGTQIGQSAGVRGDHRGKLGAIPQVPMPDIGQGAFGHKVMQGIPVGQQVGIDLQPGQCFT